MVKKAKRKYIFKKKPYKHQVAALKTLLATGWGGALLMAPRTGKTKVAVDWFSVLHQAGHVNRVLIICPNSAIGDESQGWVKEIKDNCPFAYRLIIWDKDGRKTETLPKWGRDILDIVIINFDAFSQPGIATKGRDGVMRRRRRGGRYEVVAKLKAWGPQCGVVDESHRMKTPSAQKTRAIAQVAWTWQDGKVGTVAVECLIPFRAILTGTLVTKKKRIWDIYSQWKNFLNPNNKAVKGKTLSEFKGEYSVMTDRNGFPQWLRNKPKEIERLRKLIHAESFAIEREECYDLPARLPDQLIQVPITGACAKAYDDLAEDLVTRWKNGEITQAQLKIVLRIRLLQITSGIAKTEPTPEHPEGRYIRVGRDKLIELEDRCIDWWEADQKLVVAARWKADLNAIGLLCKKHKIPHEFIRGGQKRSDRTSGIARFNRHDGPGVMIVQPTAGAEGIDLRVASLFVWYSLTDSWVNYTQVEDRIALSPVGTQYFHFIGAPIDQLIYDSLQSDTDVAKMVTASPDRLLRNFRG